MHALAPATDAYKPVAHAVHAAAAVRTPPVAELPAELYLPTGQGVHFTSEVAEPAPLKKLPAAQVVEKGVQDGAPAAEKEPAAQVEHDDAPEREKVPAAQLEHAAVAVVVADVHADVVGIFEMVPSGHGEQTRSEVSVDGSA